MSNFQCAKCPDPTLNAIRVVGVIIVALLFLAAIIIVNVRKKKENNLSILTRIFTNYVQLISTAFTFNVSMPSAFSGIFSQSDRIGTPNESFFSFD